MKNYVIQSENVYYHKGFAELKGHLKNGAKTLLELFLKNSKDYPNNLVLGKIVNNIIEYKSFGDLEKMIRKVGAFLESIVSEHEVVGIYSVNRIEWVVAEYACYISNCINCPLHITFSPESLSHIINETEMKTIVASADKILFLIDNVISKGCKNLKNIILMDSDYIVKKQCEEKGFNVLIFEEICKSTRYKLTRKHPCSEDLATICYTSGTTGCPKGAMLTHKNFIVQLEGFRIGMEKYGLADFGRNDIYISFLPLAHVFERIVFNIGFSERGVIVFSRGDVKLLKEDFKIIKPTFITVVPRVLTVFYTKIQETVDNLPIFKRMLFKLGLNWKLFWLKFGFTNSWVFDKLIFSKISNEFGGKIRGALCGGAAISPQIIDYLQCVLSTTIFQGYGQTEGLGANIVAPFYLNDSLSVGIPFITTQVKLEDDPELMKPYRHLLLKGPSISKGYYKRDDLTKTAYDKDGWLITGDIAKFENGKFYISGRSKDYFKTSFGEYILPETIENELTDNVIQEIFITNSVNSDYLLAMVYCSNPEFTVQDVANHIKEKANALVADKKMCRYEVPTHFVILSNPLSYYDNGNLITPSMKKKRHLIKEFFKAEIEQGFKIKY